MVFAKMPVTSAQGTNIQRHNSNDFTPNGISLIIFTLVFHFLLFSWNLILSRNKSSTQIIEKGFYSNITSNCGRIPQLLAFEDEMTFKAPHRHGQALYYSRLRHIIAINAVRGSHWGKVYTGGCSVRTETSSHNVNMHIKLWQKKHKLKYYLAVFMQAETKNIYLKKFKGYIWTKQCR